MKRRESNVRRIAGHQIVLCLGIAAFLGGALPVANAAGTLGQQRTLDLQIEGKGSVIVEQCERLTPFSLNSASCTEIAECADDCSVPVKDGGPVQVDVNGVVMTKWLRTWLVVRPRPKSGFAVQAVGSNNNGQRHQKCQWKATLDPADCVLDRLQNTSMQKPFVVRFTPTASIITRTTDLFRPYSRTSTTNAVRVRFHLSILFRSLVRSLRLSCAPESGGESRSVVLRTMPSRAQNPSLVRGRMALGGLEAGTTYRCTMTATTRKAGAHSLAFIVGTTGGSAGGSGTGGNASPVATSPIGPIVL